MTKAIPFSAVWVRDRWIDADALLFGNLLRGTVESECGPATGQIGDLEIVPGDSAAPSSSQRLHTRLFGCKPGRVTLKLVRLPFDIRSFCQCIDA